MGFMGFIKLKKIRLYRGVKQLKFLLGLHNINPTTKYNYLLG